MKCSKYTIGWYVLYVKSQWEKKVDGALKDLAIESFLPLTKEVRQWSDRKKTIFKPLFPSYVFVKTKSSLEFQKALTVNGVYSYIRFGTEYARVTQKEINQIKFLVGDENIRELEVNSQLPKIGDITNIAYGPLSGLKCEVIKIGNVNKVIVQIDLLNNSITATIPSHYLEGINHLQKV